MNLQAPTSWLLDERTGWRTSYACGATAGRDLQLEAWVGGPLDLVTPDGSLGRLVLPQGMAFDEDYTLYLLSPDPGRPWIKRFDPDVRRFRALFGHDCAGTDARKFRRPSNVAIAGGILYVADRGNRRVQAFALGSLALLHMWTGSGGPSEREDDPDSWDPIDIASHNGTAYLLDHRHGRVYRHRRGGDSLHLVIREPSAARLWTRIAVDRDGRIHLLDPAGCRLCVFDQEGRKLGEVSDVGSIRDRFEPPPIRLDERGRFCLPQSLCRPCGRSPSIAPSTLETPLLLCASATEDGGLVFDRHGQPASVDFAEPAGTSLYEPSGTWFSEVLDSEIPHCQWHRIELVVTSLPAGAQVELSTYAGPKSRVPKEIEDHLWETCYRLVGQIQPPRSSDRDPTTHAEFLVQSQPGRYLCLRLRLSSDGYSTPRVESIRVHYPRDSYLSHLPAVYSEDAASRSFLERYLSIFKTVWDDLDLQIAEASRNFDPESVPSGAPLARLARWLALPLEEGWSWPQKRRLLAAAPAIYPRRGTARGLRSYLQAYLRNIANLREDELMGFPRIVEGFRQRRHLMLSIRRHGNLGHAPPLWGREVVGRLRLGTFSREGQARLVSTGDPERDLFHEYAHRFRVFVPSVWIRTAEDEQLLRRAIETEKPAHTSYDLCLVDARYRIGVQSTVGVDTIIGPYPVARLVRDPDEDTPPSRPPRSRLGYDTILASGSTDFPEMQLRPGTRVGMDTVLP